MAIYLVSRTLGQVDYDEYDSFVVRAKNEQEALSLVKDKTGFDEYGVTVELVKPTGETEIILGSFNAG